MRRAPATTFTEWILAILLAIGIALGIAWIQWEIWCWAVPQLFPDGPENLIRPGFWLFLAGTFVIKMLFNMIGGKR